MAPSATVAEVRAAHRRIAGHLRAGRAPLALRRLVDEAGAVAAAGGTTVTAPDARKVLDIAAGSPLPRIKARYRDVARLCHPDLGGTDELFRVVGLAYDELSGRRQRATASWTRDDGVRRPRPPSATWAGIRVERPPKPPPPGPYVAPPPERRIRPSRVRAAVDLAFNLGVLSATLAVLGVLLALRQWWVVVGVAVLVVTSGSPARPFIHGAARALIRLRAGPARVSAGAGSPITFLEQSCLDAPVSRVPDDVLYDVYLRWCARRQRVPVSPWAFVEQLRSLGLLYVKATTWDGGVWVGLKVREAAFA